MTKAEDLSLDIRQFMQQSLGEKNLEIIPLAGDASSRRYYRIVHKDDTSVLMAWDPYKDDGRFPFLNVQQHLLKHGVRVPSVLAKSPDLGVILLEDLGDLTLERKFWENQNQSMALPYYKQAIDEILKIHLPATDDKASNCVAFSVKFDVPKLLWELHYGRDHLLEKLAKIKLSETTKKDLDHEFMDICQGLDAEPKRICHRDYHSRNLMIHRGKVHLIDFQDARLGPVQYDLVSLVYDSYVDMDDSLRTEILDYYIAGYKTGTGKTLDRDHFFQVMRLQVLQRCFKACGSFASFFNAREDRRYLKYLGPTLKRVLLTLHDFPQYRVFRTLITDHDLANKDYTTPEVAP